MTSREEIQTLLDFAIQIALDAGDIALKYFRSDLDITDKSGGNVYDPVTRADREIESYLREKIKDKYPQHSIVGEEEGISSGAQSYTWFIDPIDGTRGFVTGSPIWGTLIGLVDNNKCIAGVMHQPFIKETYIGSEAGAFLLNNQGKKRLGCSNTEKISDSIMCNTHLGMFRNDRDNRIFHELVNSCRFSRFGTDCYGYTLLAMGLVDLVLEARLETYDIIPLIPIIEAAGGVVTDWDGNSARNGGNIVACANPILHENVLAFMTNGNY